MDSEGGTTLPIVNAIKADMTMNEFIEAVTEG